MSRTNPDGTITLHGKVYHPVSMRVSAFRKDHPIGDGWGLITKLMASDADHVIFRAAVVNPDGAEVAVGYAEERRTNRGINSTSALENAETSAIGRALAAAGFGGGGEYASANEVQNAIAEQQRRDRAVESVQPNTRLEKPAEDRPPHLPLPPPQFWERIQEISPRIVWADILRLCDDKKQPYPHLWSQERRAGFVAKLKAGKFPTIWTPGAK